MARKATARTATVVSLPTPTRARPAPPEAALGRLVAVSPEGAPLVQVAGERTVRPARTAVPLRPSHLGADVTLLLEDPRGRRRPVVTGVVLAADEAARGLAGAETQEARVDGRRVLLTAEEEITLRCGKALITLRRDGKVVVRGANLLQLSSGLNRIKGAAVQIN